MQAIKEIAKTVVYGAIHISTAGRGVTRTVCGEPVRFPARWFRYYPATYEPETFAFLRANCRPGDTVLDIGAHIGLFSVVLARLVGPGGRVFSFEPTPLSRSVLQETVQLNGCGQVVEVRGEAVGASSGTATFYDTGHEVSNANSLVQTGRSRGGITVETVSVDDFAAARGLSVNCLKIDVEGAELGLLRGAARVFDECRPAARLGLHPDAIEAGGGSLRDIWELLRRYRMSVTYGGEPVDEHWFCRQENLFDVSLLPSERA